MKLSKKVCLITGGSKGIGEAVVRLFFNEGAQVILQIWSMAVTQPDS